MANATNCRHCGEALGASPKATNQCFCSAECRDAWWNAERSNSLTRAQVAEKMFGPAPDFILSTMQAVWLAALIDGEGTIGIYREKRRGNSSGYRYRAAVSIANTNLELLTQVIRFVDGTMSLQDRRSNERHKKCYRVHARQRAIPALLEQIKDFLIVKRKQAEVVLQFCRAVENAPVRASQDHEIFEQLYLECKELNKRGT